MPCLQVIIAHCSLLVKGKFGKTSKSPKILSKDCLENFIFLLIPLLRAKFVKSSHI